MRHLLFIIMCVLVTGCASTGLVTVPQQHTEHHWHTDSVRERDSVHTENSTIIRELDSAAMARYGIQLKNAERAWLVQSREMEMRLRELEHMTASRDTMRDSIPVPYPVIKEVPADLTWWQKFRLHLGNIALMLLGIGIVVLAVRLWLKMKN